jgi:LytS/YehU family sensor histidine kinase
MLLLPLAENAVKHGAAAGLDGEVVLAVEAAPTGDVRVRLENAGAFGGRRAGGLGLALVERRLALAYDGRAAFRIAAAGPRTVAEVSFPGGVAPREERV